MTPTTASPCGAGTKSSGLITYMHHSTDQATLSLSPSYYSNTLTCLLTTVSRLATHSILHSLFLVSLSTLSLPRCVSSNPLSHVMCGAAAAVVVAVCGPHIGRLSVLGRLLPPPLPRRGINNTATPALTGGRPGIYSHLTDHYIGTPCMPSNAVGCSAMMSQQPAPPPPHPATRPALARYARNILGQQLQHCFRRSVHDRQFSTQWLCNTVRLRYGFGIDYVHG